MIIVFFNFLDDLNSISILCSFISRGANMIVVEMSIVQGLRRQFLSLLGPINVRMERFIKKAPEINI